MNLFTLIASLLLLLASEAGAKDILLLLSYHPGHPMEEHFTAGINQTFDSARFAGASINTHIEYLDGKRFPPPVLDSLHRDVLKKLYPPKSLDAVIVEDNIALDFALKNRLELFANLPIIFLGIDDYSDSLLQGNHNISGIAENVDINGTLQLMDSLQPNLQNLYVIVDQSETGFRMRHETEVILNLNWKTLRTHWLTNMSMREVEDSLSIPRSNSAALFLTYAKDREGVVVSQNAFLQTCTKRSKIPIYSLWNHYLDDGIVGGKLMSGKYDGNIAAQMVLKIFAGAAADELPILKTGPTQAIVDYEVLQRFGFSTAQVPKGVVIRDHRVSLWKQYSQEIAIIGIFVLALLVTIFMLVRNIMHRKYELTFRREAESQLRQSREQYRVLVEYANSVIIQWDPQGVILFLNEYGERIFQFAKGELIGKNILETIVPENDSHGRNLHSMISSVVHDLKEFSENENENMSKDGKRIWIRWHNRAIYNEQGKLESILSVGSDNTEKHRRDEEIMQFNYRVSHDLRTPLITVNSFLAMLREDIVMDDNESIRTDLEYIDLATRKMGRLLDELLALSRVGRKDNDHQRVRLDELVNEAAALTSGSLRLRGVTLLFHVAQKIWITGDRTRLVEVFQNLLDNATKYMGEQANPVIEIGIEMRDNRSLIFVRDNGKGIEKKFLEKIFGLFETLHSESDGTGLGLALVKRVIEVHGGRIWAESEGLNRGSSFYFFVDKIEIDSVGEPS